MGTPGRKPKTALQVVREGNPGHRPVPEGVKLPPSALTEPTWSHIFPGSTRAERRARSTAHGLWQRLAPVMHRSVGLVNEQQELLVEFCVTWARIEQGERALSMQGVLITTERGQAKNPWTTVLNQYRTHFRSLVGELGLTPSALTRLGPRPGGSDDGDDDPDDPFD